MTEIRQTVDDRDGAVLRQILDVGLLERADHHAVEVAREDADGVLHRFAARDLHIVCVEERAVAAELVRADLERRARARGRLLEDECHGLAVEILVRDAVLLLVFQIGRDVEQFVYLGRGEVEQFQKVFHEKSTSSFSLAISI